MSSAPCVAPRAAALASRVARASRRRRLPARPPAFHELGLRRELPRAHAFAAASSPKPRPRDGGASVAEPDAQAPFAFVPAGAPSYDWTKRSATLKPLPPPPAGVADDPAVHNPLERLERLGTGWMGAIFEWEGVIVEDAAEQHKEAWLTLAEELGKAPPPAFMLKKAVGMKSSQVVSEVFCWAREPMAVRKLAARKDELMEKAMGGRERAEQPGVRAFLERLQSTQVPCAIGCSESAASVERGLVATGLKPYFEAVITGDDVQRGRPDPECYLYSAQAIGRPPARCIVIGNANTCIEAAQEGGMKAVAVANRHALYELSAADLVVRQLDELSIVNLKKLFAVEQAPAQPEVQHETEDGGGDDNEDDDADDSMFGSRLF